MPDPARRAAFAADTLTRAPEEQSAGIEARVHPWAGEDRDLALLLHIETMTGRSVQRDTRTPKI